jgi:HTH-type transcriptional regulator, competence development regulator
MGGGKGGDDGSQGTAMGKQISQSFGVIIRNARKRKGYTLRELAPLANIDFTYLSKLENDKALHPPSEGLVCFLAGFLDLDEERLIYLSGRIPQSSLKLLGSLAKKYPDEVARFFCQLKQDPTFVFNIARE